MAIWVDENLCKSCNLCAILCPKKVLELGDKVNQKGYNYIQAVREGDCTKCGLCERICPDFAIHIEK